MRKIILITLLLGFSQILTSQESKLKITTNKNIELLGIGYFIGFEGVGIEEKTVEVNGKEIPKKEWHNYGYRIYNKYKLFAQSKNLIKCFSIADHLWLDYLSAFLLQVDEVPNAKLTNDINESYYINFSKKKNLEEAKVNASIFLDGLNQFSKEIDIDSYLKESKHFYDKAMLEVKNSIPNTLFVKEMETFHKKKFDEYILVPSLTIPKGMGFGPSFSKNNKKFILSVFGAVDFQNFDDDRKLSLGFNNIKKIRELSVHEFGHSFINPEIDKLPDSILKQTEKLFIPLKSDMENQGYTNWKTCVYEHFVRASEILISEKIAEVNETNTLYEEYINERNFKYIPIILEELRKYEKGIYPTFYKAVEASMKKLVEL